MSDETKPEEPRVRLDGTTLHVGTHYAFDAEQLKQWKTWSSVESACKVLDPEITSAELAVLEDAAAHLGSGARNGLTELKQALAQAKKG